jgi:hypothetical protein
MQGPNPTRVGNILPEGTGTCYISNIPIDFSAESGAVSSESLNLMISSFSIHGFSVNTVKEGHFAVRVTMPVNIENAFKGSFTTNIVIDDELDNYWTLYRYARTLISPMDAFPITDKTMKPHLAGAYANRRMYINHIGVEVGDSNLELRNVYLFKRCYITNFGDIDFSFPAGTSAKTVAVTWSYDDIDFRRVDKDCTIANAVGD